MQLKMVHGRDKNYKHQTISVITKQHFSFLMGRREHVLLEEEP